MLPLNFSNPSRSYDATRHAVHFWGYDTSIEVSFFVTDDALRKLGSSRDSTENDCLRMFDAHCDKIHMAAAKVYKRGSKGSYELGPQNF